MLTKGSPKQKSACLFSFSFVLEVHLTMLFCATVIINQQCDLTSTSVNVHVYDSWIKLYI